MGEEAVHVRMEQADKNKNVSAQIKEMDDEIIQLQRDILDQDATNKEQRQKIDHLEKVIEDLIDRIAQAEDKATQEEKTTQRAKRSTSSQ